MDRASVLVSKHKKIGRKAYNSRIFGARFLVTRHNEPLTSGDAGEEKRCGGLP
jgi:hypothetical protein